MLVFQNHGEIDPRSITTFGVNVKEKESAIGFFGTGLKYGIAVMLRLGQHVVCYSGEKRYDFAKRVETIRGKQFEMVYMNDSPMGFTTELGKNWELWMAYREFACNTLDENGTITKAADYKRQVGVTAFCVTGALIEEVYDNRSRFMLESPPDVVVGKTEIRRKASDGFFYRGVRVLEFQKASMLTYNTLEEMVLTEDRTIKHTYQAQEVMSRAISNCRDKDILRKALTCDKSWMESDFSYGFHSPTDEFFEVIEEAIKDKITKINTSAYNIYKVKMKAAAGVTRMRPSKVQEKMLQKAIDFCVKIKFPVDEYEIVLAADLGAGVFGMAEIDHKLILLAAKAFEGGTKQVAATLIEEWIHLKKGFFDESRNMQDYLLEQLVSMGEELIGEPV